MLFGTIYGVDFSGAKLAGRNTWVARLEPAARGPGLPLYELTDLAPLESRFGTAERATSLAHLVGMIASSEQALWAMDFPFGLPVEVMEPGSRWPDQLAFLRAWGEDDYGVGLECLRRAKALGGPNHIRRLTDTEKAPSIRTITALFTRRSMGCATCWARCGGTGGPPFYRSTTAGSRRPAVCWSRPARPRR